MGSGYLIAGAVLCYVTVFSALLFIATPTFPKTVSGDLKIELCY